MLFAAASDKPEVTAELSVYCFGRISRHIETTTSHRAVLGKCRHEHEPSWPDHFSDLCDVAGTIRNTGEKMEYGTVMPDIERSCA